MSRGGRPAVAMRGSMRECRVASKGAAVSHPDPSGPLFKSRARKIAPFVLPDHPGASADTEALEAYSLNLDFEKHPDKHPGESLAWFKEWDYPEDLYRQGGWLNPQSVEWFERYPQSRGNPQGPQPR